MKQKLNVKARLLKAATDLFSKFGYDGTTVDEIVLTAGVNKRMVYHYFGSKEVMYQEVLKEVFYRLRTVELASIQPGDPIEKTLKNLVHVYFNFLAANPEFINLLLWENLAKGRHLHAELSVLSKSPLINLLTEVISEGTRQGVIQEGLNPKYLLINIIGLCQIYFSNSYTLSHTVEIDLQSPSGLEAGIEQVFVLLSHGILKSPVSF